MRFRTEYLWFHTHRKRELINITDKVQDVVGASEIQEGMVLVSAMHITAGVFVNDQEPGLWQDIDDWVEKLAPSIPTIDITAPARPTETRISRACSSIIK